MYCTTDMKKEPGNCHITVRNSDMVTIMIANLAHDLALIEALCANSVLAFITHHYKGHCISLKHHPIGGVFFKLHAVVAYYLAL